MKEGKKKRLQISWRKENSSTYSFFKSTKTGSALKVSEPLPMQS